MALDYGYGDLENELIELFSNISPDFKKAEELLKLGADVNALGEDPYENVLSTIIDNYVPACIYGVPKEGDGLALTMGPTLCKIIQFFLFHGFDVNKCNGRFGAQCLLALVLSTHDRYIIEASKILFDAGAKNCAIEDNEEDGTTPWNLVGAEGSFQDVCVGNHSLANIYEALYQVYQAIEDGMPYNGIDSYECAIGKKILKVLAFPNDKSSIFYPINLPNFKKENCFTSDLYFVYDGGVLRTTKFADFWVDTVLPDGELVDVSEYFPKVIGSVIEEFHFSKRKVKKEKSVYTQPITRIKMESGQSIKFSINFGDVEDEDRVAFFELKQNNQKEVTR